jgi:hypothetical protein
LGGVPAGAAAAVLNVTAVDPTAAGFLTVWPQGTAMPTVSNLNFAAGHNVANLVTVGLSSGGAVSVYANTGSTNVVADVEGYYTNTAPSNGLGLYNPLAPTRVLGNVTIGQAIGSNSTQNVPVTGNVNGDGVPATATAVVVNVTAAHATMASFLTVFPTGGSQPLASNLNFPAQAPLEAIANRVTVPVGTGGAITVYNLQGTVNVDVDVTGYYSGAGGTGSLFAPITPVRLDDTRSTSHVGTGTPIAPNAIENFSLQPTAGTSSSVATNFTVVPGAAPGYITVFPTSGGTTVPVASDVNWTASQSPAVANFTNAFTQGTGTVNVANSFFTTGATVDLIIDAFGTFTQSTTTLNTVAVTANPTTLVANGTSQSTITATVTNPGGPVAGDAVTFTTAGSPAAACGSVLPTSGVTNASGVATTTYTSSTTVGFCTVTATEALQLQSGSATVTQTTGGGGPTYTITVTAVPPTIVGDGTSTSTITATVQGASSTPISGDMVHFSLGATGCGSFVPPAFVATNASGQATVTYTSLNTGAAATTNVVCTITAQEAATAQSGTTTVTQTPKNYSITLTATPQTLVANTLTTSVITATVKNQSGGLQGGVTVNFSSVGGDHPAGACGTPATATATTNPSGQASFTYTSSLIPGFCTITGTETTTGQSGTVTLDQTNPAATTPHTITVTATPPTIVGDGTSTSTITATVQGASSTPIPNDMVHFSLGATGCGTFVPPAFVATNASGQATVTYTSLNTGAAATTNVVCTITAQEADTAQSATTTVTQTPKNYSITLTATPQTLVANGLTTSLITATVHNQSGVVQGGVTVNFSSAGNPGAACGTPATATATTNPSGQASFTYTSSTTPGFCTITGTETTTAQSGTVTLDQTTP